MSMWKDSTASRPTPVPEPVRADTAPKPQYTPVAPATPLPLADAGASRKESLIAPDITIEGKIEGNGSVRVAGKFKGDVNVQGDLTIEIGAKLTGGVRADKVTVAGELEGNIEESSRVDLQQTGVVSGDIKAGSLTVAAGARMRGHVEFGWDQAGVAKPHKPGNGRDLESKIAS